MKENEFDTQNAIDEVLLSFTTEDLDSYTPDTKRIVYTQEQKDVICAKALTLFKQDQVLPENNNVHKIPLDYLPRDKINEEHVTRVYGVNEKYNKEAIDQHIREMTNLKHTFKHRARVFIEGGYLTAAQMLGWKHYDGQMLMNKNHLYAYIKLSKKDESDLQSDLYHLTYDRFKKGDNDRIVKFVKEYMIENNIAYYDQEKKKKNERKKMVV